MLTQAMVQERISAAELIRLTDDVAAGTVDTAVLALAVGEGEGELLGYIGQRYAIPLALTDTDTRALVYAMCMDAVIYRLYLRRRAVPEDYLEAYRRAVQWAREVGAGKAGLVGESPLSAAPGSVGQMVIEGSSRVVTRESMSGL